MAKADKLIAAFKACRTTFKWRDFENMLTQMGYSRCASGKTGGSRRKFIHPEKIMLWMDEPHDGIMTQGMVRRLRKDLENGGVL